jgi:phospholipid/cholesterol/gamma-HCH transport system substrate-binding protein
MMQDNHDYEIEYAAPRWRSWRTPRFSQHRFSQQLSGRLMSVVAAAAALVVLVTGVLWYRASHSSIEVTAYFSQSIGVYPGSDVRVLGVQVGRIDSTSPDGTLVKVMMSVDANVAVPADAQAIVITSGVVGDRYVQLSPPYTGGPRMASGAVIPVGRTAVPLEVDQIYASLSKFFTALGPNGINKTGALSSLIKAGASVLRGNGQNLSNMITQFSALNRTLGGSSGNFFATIANLGVFNSMLARNDSQVRLAQQQLASVTGYLAADRQSLGTALNTLATALAQVSAFIASNRGLITSNVDKLAAITRLLVAERASLAEALSTAPLAVDNLLNAYDAADKSLAGRGDLNELSLGPAAKLLAGQDQLPASAVPVSAGALTSLPPLPLPTVGTVYGIPAR